MGCICSLDKSGKNKEKGNGDINQNPIEKINDEFNRIESPKIDSQKIESIIIEQDDLKTLKEFQKEIIIQDNFFIRKEDKNDFIYYDLKNYERENLEKQFNDRCQNYENEKLKNFSIDNIDKGLIESVLENEHSKDRFRKVIADNIEKIISDNKKYNIEHLTILLVGRENVGKTTLIKYILDSENEENLEITEDEKSYFKN